jgi:hypothetical protein
MTNCSRQSLRNWQNLLLCRIDRHNTMKIVKYRTNGPLMSSNERCSARKEPYLRYLGINKHSTTNTERMVYFCPSGAEAHPTLGIITGDANRYVSRAMRQNLEVFCVVLGTPAALRHRCFPQHAAPSYLASANKQVLGLSRLCYWQVVWVDRGGGPPRYLPDSP